MRLKDFIYFGENSEITYTNLTPLYYSKYHYKNYSDCNTAIKIVNASSKGVRMDTNSLANAGYRRNARNQDI